MGGREPMLSEQREIGKPSFSLSACSTNSPSSQHKNKHLRFENSDIPICSSAGNFTTHDGDDQFCYSHGECSTTVVDGEDDAGECSSRPKQGFMGGEKIGTLEGNVDGCNAMIDYLDPISNGRTRRNSKKSKASTGQAGMRILSRRQPILRIQSGLRSRRRRLSNENNDEGMAKRNGGTSWGDNNDLHNLGLFLGMPIAAVFTQVLDGKSYAGQRIESDHLLMIFSSALRESLAHGFGNRFDCFIRSFEKSFGSTLKTLRSVNETSSIHGQKIPCSTSNIEGCHTSESQPYSLGDPEIKTLRSVNETSSIRGQKIPWSTSNIEGCHTSESQPCSLGDPEISSAAERVQDGMLDRMSQQIILHSQASSREMTSVARSTLDFRFNEPIMDRFEKSIMEQTRSNDLKTLEIGLTMQKLRMKQSQLALDSQSNFLKRISISMGISKASFKEEKLKGQLEDARYAEFLRKCTDCLVFGLVIMSASLAYGTYIYSYDRIKEATASCTSSPKKSKSWWIPNPVSSVSTQLLEIRCQLQVLSHMLLGVSMVLAVAYFLLRQADLSRRTMPWTIIILLLGVACGFAGKLCVDMLGGSGYHWLLYWEVLCSLHLFANTFTSALFHILNGPISVSQATDKAEMMLLPYWVRKCTFYSLTLLVVPVLCGLMPFASFYAWKDHFSDRLLRSFFGE